MENPIRNGRCEGFRSKEEEYRIIDDLTGFDNLKAMLEAEDIIMRRKGLLKTKKMKKKKKKRKNYGYFQFLAQEGMPVCIDVMDGEEASKDGVAETFEVLKTNWFMSQKEMHQKSFLLMLQKKRNKEPR